MGGHELEHVRRIALSLPGVHERLSHGAPCFFVGGTRSFCYFHDAEFSRDGRVSLWCPVPRGVQEELVTTAPERFFAPTPSASGVCQDWVAVYLDEPDDDAIDWGEIEAIVEDAYRLRAPKRLIAELDAR